MKFLTKNSKSVILKNKLTYRENSSRNNRKLKDELLKEQKQFCAYTELYINDLVAVDVEHFNAALKYNDDYYNYYAVIRRANLYKKDVDYRGAKFFTSLFFQDRKQLDARIKYTDGIYIEADETDDEAKKFIDFLGFNHPALHKQRRRHIKRLSKNFKDAEYSPKQRIEYFKEHKEDLSFITAIEHELELDLTNLLK